MVNLKRKGFCKALNLQMPHRYKWLFSYRCAVLLVIMMLFGVNTEANAADVLPQTKVTGTVVDNRGETLPGVSIQVLGATRGVITDLDGTYSIDVRAKDKLVFSFVGYAPQTIEVGSQSIINVFMQEKGNELEGVTVVGYGTQRKESVIGAITTVSMKDLRMPVGKISSSLAGQMAGVVAVNRSGEPGAGADFWIRGIATFGANTKPLILVDGIERPIDLVDTEDIETFSILKDATATAIYGVRGANGVVLITTRRGVEGKPRISARVESGLNAPTQMVQMANAEQFIDTYNEVYREVYHTDFFSPEVRQKYLDHSDPDLYPNVNWMDVIYKDVATSQRVNLNVTGGSERVKYYVAGSYYNENGIFNTSEGDYNPEMKWTKFSFRSNIDIKLTNSTVINMNLSNQYDTKNRPDGKSGDEVWDYLYIHTYVTAPVAVPVIYSDGTLAVPPDYGVNPYNRLNHSGYVKQFNNNAQSLIGISQDFSELITPGLKANAKFSWDVVNSSKITRHLNPPLYYATGRDDAGHLILHQRNSDGSDYLAFSNSLTGSKTFYVEASTTYDRLFSGKHRVGGLILYNLSERVNTVSSYYEPSIPNRHLGIAGRATYSYLDRYFIEGNFGYNGSENFAPKKRYGFFPSVAVGYLISNEAFFEPLRESVSLLKLKASRGMSGNDVISTSRRFAFNSTMNQSARGWTFGTTGQTSRVGIATDYPGNDEVGWEESTKTNIGIELGLFNQLKLQVDYFDEDRSNIFVERQSVPSVVGVNTNPYMNLGRVKNKGVDASLEYNKQINDFFISARANFTFNRNKSLYDDSPTPIMAYMDPVGKPLKQQFGLVAIGLFESQEDIDTSPTQEYVRKEDLRVGDLKYRDINGDGVINDYDQVAIGRSSIPEYNYGFGASAMWKGFDLSVFFQGVGNVTGILGGTPINGFGDVSLTMDGIFAEVVEQRWSEANPDPNAKYPRLSLQGSENNNRNTTHRQRDMSFMRLKSAEMGYTIPKEWTKKVHISTCRLYLQGVNLLTFSPFKMWDPETMDAQGATYPNMRIVNLGINLNF